MWPWQFPFLMWPSLPSSMQQKEDGPNVCQVPSRTGTPDFCLITRPRQINGQEQTQTREWLHRAWRQVQVPLMHTHLEFLMYTFLQDFSSLAVLHLHFPLLCQNPSFFIGQGIAEFLGDLCFLLSPFKRAAAGVNLVKN